MNIQKAYHLLDEFFAGGKELRYKNRDNIVPMGTIPEYAYWIKSGAVKVFSSDSSGNVIVFHTFKPQEFFPVAWIFNDIHYSVGYSAFTPTVLQAQPIQATKDFLNREPFALLALVHQQSSITDQLLNLTMPSAEQKVASRLKHLAIRFGRQEENHIIIKLPITIKEFSQSVQLSRESTGKILHNLEQSGAVIMSRQSIIVYPEKLEQHYGNHAKPITKA